MKYIIILLIMYFLLDKFYHKDEKKVIENGNIVFKFFNDSYNIENLISDLNNLKIYDITKVDKAYLKRGKLIVKTNKPHIVIYNGILDLEELKMIKKNKKFVFDLLEKKNLEINEVLYAIYLNNNLYIGLRIAK